MTDRREQSTVTDEETRHVMTPEEIALMRRIIAWRKAHEIEFVKRRVLGTYWVDAFGFTGPKRRAVALELKHSPDAPIGVSPGPQHSYVWYGAESVTQAVDLLVAYGYLPARFSSAYWNGTADTVAVVRAALGDVHDADVDGDHARGWNGCRAAVAVAVSDHTVEALG